MDELLSIGEFSDQCGLTPKMLRSYADAGLLLPAAVDPESGYRYYSPGQLHDAAIVAALRQAGISVADIRAFVEHPTAARLTEWERQLEEEGRTRRAALQRVRDLAVLTGSPERSRPQSTVPYGGAVVSHLQASSATDIGRVRGANEDVVVAEDRLVAVADGMGGAPGGALAARTAADALRARFDGGDLGDLRDAVLAANADVWSRARADDELHGMGTTMCAAALVQVDGETHVGVANVGDSRAYLVRDGSIQQLTEDHTVVADLIRRGELEPDEAASHPHRHVLTRVLGMGPAVDVDTVVVAPQPGDRLLLCTDGLYNEIDEEQMAAVLASAAGQPETVAEDLVAAALEAGGNDNVSVVVVDFDR